MSRPPSALVGQPPRTADDLLIIRGMFLWYGIDDEDPRNGLEIETKPPPPGQPITSNQPQTIILAVFAIGLMLLFTSTRLGIRVTNKSLSWGWDDWSIVVATLFSLVTPILMIYRVTCAGTGKHIYQVTYWELANSRAMGSIGLIPFYVALAATKISIVLFYMRLSSFTSKGWMLTHRIMIGILCICAIVTTFVTAFQCLPPIRANVREMARRNVRPKCLPIFQEIVGFNVWHILTDIVLLVIPFKLLWKIQLKWTTKLRVCIAGIVGIANVALSLARTILQATESGGGDDYTFDVTQSSFIVGELLLGIFTANLPILSVVATRGVKKVSAWTGIRLSALSPSRNLPSRKAQGGRQKQHNLLNQQGAPKVASDPQSSSHVSAMRPSPREYVEFGKDGMHDDVMELREVHEKSNV